jgi:Intracellular proteinase inhibitor
MNRLTIVVVLLACVGCVEEAAVAPFPEQVIPAQISASDRDLQPGESTTITVTLMNTLEEEVQLAFPTSCQALVFIRNSAGRVMTPASGAYVCAAVPSLLTIQAGATATFTTEWGGGVEFGPASTSTRVPPGSYFASAEMRADNYHAIAFPITIVVH